MAFPMDSLSRLTCWSTSNIRPQANNGKQHFTSLHGKVGNINTWLAVATPVGGIFSFRKLGLITCLPEPWHPFIKWLHRCVSCRIERCSMSVSGAIPCCQDKTRGQCVCSIRPVFIRMLPLSDNPTALFMQLGLLTWMLALVTVQLVLPHKAIMQVGRIW